MRKGYSDSERGLLGVGISQLAKGDEGRQVYSRALSATPASNDLCFICFAFSLNTLLSNFPDGFLGTESVNSTPPVKHLYETLWSDTCCKECGMKSDPDLAAPIPHLP